MRVLEGSADAAALVLMGYDAASDRFRDPRSGEFWDAVALAHQQGMRGQGRTVAIVDTGFDTSLPAIAGLELRGENPAAKQAHGTTVALLAREVAPDARFLLYPTGAGDEVDDDRVAQAIDDAVATEADVINLSLGEAYPIRELVDIAAMVGDAGPDASVMDVIFTATATMAQREWRSWVRQPAATVVDDAVAHAVEAGVVVIAACGNDDDALYSPALREGVHAIAFQTVERGIPDGLMEVAVSGEPFGFSQTILHDIALVQPPLTLGSSFASPLLAGFAAVLPNPATLPTHFRQARLGSLAAGAMPLLDTDTDSPRWADRWRLVDALFDAALEHRHDHPIDRGCPECQLFAASSVINAGLFWFNSRQYDRAVVALADATGFAPANPHGHANYAMTLAAQASDLLDAGDTDAASMRLFVAAEHMRTAVRLRPDHEPYAARLAEFTAVAADPGTWRLEDHPHIPEPHPTPPERTHP